MNQEEDHFKSISVLHIKKDLIGVKLFYFILVFCVLISDAQVFANKEKKSLKKGNIFENQ